MSGYQDSNLGPPAPKAGALTGLRYTPHCTILLDVTHLIFKCGAKVALYFKYTNKLSDFYTTLNQLQRNILYKRLDSLVRSQSQGTIQFRSSTVTILSTLPEQTFVISQEGCTLCLRLMFQNGIPFET